MSDTAQVPPLKLIEIKHRRVAAFGWLEDSLMMFVRFRSGQLWAIPGVNAGHYNTLMVMESASQGDYLEALRYNCSQCFLISGVVGPS